MQMIDRLFAERGVERSGRTRAPTIKGEIDFLENSILAGNGERRQDRTVCWRRWLNRGAAEGAVWFFRRECGVAFKNDNKAAMKS